MKKLKELLSYYFEIISLILIFILLSGIIYIIYINKIDNKDITNSKNSIAINESNEEKIVDFSDKIKVDIKGAVKKAGVYENL